MWSILKMTYGIGITIFRSATIIFSLQSSIGRVYLIKKTEGILLENVKGIKERYAIEIQTIGFDKNHVHILCRFLPKYSGSQ